MEKVLWNSIDKKQNGLNNLKIANHPPSPVNNNKHNIVVFYWKKYNGIQLRKKMT